MIIITTLVLIYILARVYQETVQADKDHKRVQTYFDKFDEVE